MGVRIGGKTRLALMGAAAAVASWGFLPAEPALAEPPEETTTTVEEPPTPPAPPISDEGKIAAVYVGALTSGIVAGRYLFGGYS